MSTSKHLGLLALLGAVALGCDLRQAPTPPTGPSLDGGKYILNSEPADPQTPTEIKNSITEGTSIAVAGKIDAGDIEPFQDGVAAFMISQLPDASHGGADHADDCPFCARKLRNAPKAVVRLLDENGELIQADARQLLGVSKGDVVVVQGLATYMESINTVQIDAEGIFIR